MAADRPTVTIADLNRLQDQANRPDRLTAEEVNDFAVAALLVLTGMTRGDKLRVIRRMRSIVG